MVDALQGARAYQAARAGLGWAVARINVGGSCADVNGAAPAFAALSGFTLTLTCTSQAYTEGNKTPTVYNLRALSEFGGFSSRDYVSRQVTVSIVMGG